MKEHLQQLTLKYSEGKLNLKEQIEFSELMAGEINCPAEQLLLDDWMSHLESDIITNRDLSPILDKVHHRIRMNEQNNYKQFNWKHSFQRVAAILFIPLLLSTLAYFYYNSEKSIIVSFAEIYCPMGVRTRFQLPDGSTGFLNSGSRLKYNLSFTKERIVELSGEAFFEIVKNEKIPFHVNTKNLDIKVLGTTFNVIAYDNEKTEEIVLQTGKVSVLSRSGKLLTSMSPNKQLILYKEEQILKQKGVLASQYTSWKDGKLTFRNENMEQVALRLSRWYNAAVTVEDSLLNSYTFYATFIDEPLDEVLKLISITSPISYIEEKRTSDKNGIYQKRKIILRFNYLRDNQFR